MNVEKVQKETFAVIGKEGSTLDGEGFIQKLWEDANIHFREIEHLAKKDDQGNPAGVWGVMSDFTRSFLPWEDFRQGLYLAGVECVDEAEPPAGWTKWVVPAYEYLRVENKENGIFLKMIEYMKENGLSLAGAVHDFTSPQTGENYMLFPIRKL